MKKVTKKELVEKANDHELRIFQIEKALKQHGINWFVEEPKLKQLDQSVFDGVDAKWRFAAVDESGKAFVYDGEPESRGFVFGLSEEQDGANDYCGLGDGYDTTDWQHSLIERKELTGSDLCHAMLCRGDSWVLIKPSDHNDKDAMSNNQYPEIVTGFDGDGFYCAGGRSVEFGVPINNQGEPLTAAEAGL